MTIRATALSFLSLPLQSGEANKSRRRASSSCADSPLAPAHISGGGGGADSSARIRSATSASTNGPDGFLTLLLLMLLGGRHADAAAVVDGTADAGADASPANAGDTAASSWRATASPRAHEHDAGLTGDVRRPLRAAKADIGRRLLVGGKG